LPERFDSSQPRATESGWLTEVAQSSGQSPKRGDMLKLRHLLILSILCALTLASKGMGQSLTLVQDTVLNPDGSTFNGTLTLNWVGGSGSSVTTPSTTASVISGLFSVLLQPTTTVTPCAYYSATFVTSSGDASYTSQWFVPPSSEPQSIADVSTANSACTALSPPPANPNGTPSLTVTSSLTFAAQTVGTTSSAQTAVVTDGPSIAVTFSSVSITGANAGDFAISSNACTGLMSGGVSCSISVTFKPTAVGARSAQLQVADNGVGSPQVVQLSGTGQTAPSLTVTSSLTFSTQTVGSTSSAQAATLSSTGSLAVSFSSFSITGTNASDFAISGNTCGSSLTDGSTCSVDVTFDPTAGGTRSAQLQIADNVSGSPQLVQLSGTGQTPPSLTVTSNLTFSSQTVGTTSAAQGAEVTATGQVAVSFSSFSITGTNAGDFSISSNTCGSSLTDGSTCTAYIAFKPTAGGARSAQLQIADNVSGSPQVVQLSGTGQAGITVTPSLTFAAETVASTSAAQNVTLQNPTGTAYSFSGFTLTGANASDYAISANTCGASIGGNTSCAVSVTFTPTGPGVRTAALQITDSAPGSPQSTGITGTGLGSSLTVTGSLTFPATGLSTSSTPLSVSIQNTGGAPVTFSSFALSGANTGDFAISGNTCSSTLTSGSTCQLNVTFSPQSAGSRTASITITDNATNTPQTVTLAGTGAITTLSLPSSVTFASQYVSTTSAALQASLQNTGSVTAVLNTFSLTGTNSGDFRISANTCATTLAAGASCQVSVTFSPTATGTRNASLVVNDSASNSPQTAPISGTGIPAALTITPFVPFGTEGVGVTSSPQTILVQNAGTLTITLSGTSLAGANPSEFEIFSNTCGASLPGGATCQVVVTFTPASAASFAASLQIGNSGSPNPVVSSLSGTGVGVSLTVTPQLTFASQIIGVTSASQGLTVQNTGAVAAGLTGLVITGANSGDFAISSNTCGTTLQGAASCQINVTFTPEAAGSRSATLQITDTGTNSPQTAALSGTGTGAQLTITPSLAFGTLTLGASSTQAVNIQNSGGLPVTLSGYTMAGVDPGDFSVGTNNCPSSLAVGASCQVYIAFAPVASESRVAVLEIANSTPFNLLNVALGGTGSVALPLLISQVSGLAAALASSANNTVSVTFVDAETPGGLINGINSSFTLAQTPNPGSSLEIFRNGVLQQATNDYTLSGSTITFSNLPVPDDILLAYYRVNGPDETVSFSDSETPTGLVNGINNSYTLANTPTGGLRVFKNGVLLNAGADYAAAGATLTFSNSAIPNAGDILVAYYRY
jgi:hypothetical protein